MRFGVLWLLLPLFSNGGILSHLPLRNRLPTVAEFERLKAEGKFSNTTCPCSSPSLCNPITREYKRELYGFGTSNTNFKWMNYTHATTIAWPGTDPQHMCAAHSHGVRLIPGAPGDMPFTNDANVRAQWIAKTIEMIKTLHHDGVTFDFEGPLNHTDPMREQYVTLVKETTEAFHKELPGSKISVCVGWSPNDIDERDYDYVGLADASDLLYVMIYDTRSQIFDRCIASANAPSSKVIRGISEFMRLGISPSKLIAGLPWYGYKYDCVDMETPKSSFCPIAFSPWRGYNCSDAVGREYAFDSIMQWVTQGKNITSIRYDPATVSKFFNMVLPPSQQVHQVWFDDAQTASAKWNMAFDLGVKGVGPFTFGDILSDMYPKEHLAFWTMFDRWFSGNK